MIVALENAIGNHKYENFNKNLHKRRTMKVQKMAQLKISVEIFRYETLAMISTNLWYLNISIRSHEINAFHQILIHRIENQLQFMSID